MNKTTHLIFLICALCSCKIENKEASYPKTDVKKHTEEVSQKIDTNLVNPFGVWIPLSIGPNGVAYHLNGCHWNTFRYTITPEKFIDHGNMGFEVKFQNKEASLYLFSASGKKKYEKGYVNYDFHIAKLLNSTDSFPLYLLSVTSDYNLTHLKGKETNSEVIIPITNLDSVLTLPNPCPERIRENNTGPYFSKKDIYRRFIEKFND